MTLERWRPVLRLWAPTPYATAFRNQTRCLHSTRPSHPIPSPRPFVPDVETFLKLIGRGLSRYASKFPSWDSLFSLTGPELQQLGIEPTRNRRYLLRWMQKYRKGDLGPGGDFEYVKDGEAILKLALPPADQLKQTKFVVNVPHPEAEVAEPPKLLPRPMGYTVRGEKTIAGPYAMPLPQSGVSVKVTEGMWEQRRGRKIDGGERRRSEVLFKKRSAERRAQREADLLSRL
ncbi:Protein FYV4 [Emericellopsis cladophorae]|uniref:Small ribosomal subunit protein mS41 n=1 Tax=Emericellopsis cladophorae TaxID=2686198 RepID=A0A9P9Y4A3_9HYPO|nr:Protein FYV4 [Emericellopsis cladophorae]KAI6782850.1 Protein FYV4 [Emericellopsis cladophorae]